MSPDRRSGVRRPRLAAGARYLRRHHLALLALFIALGGTSYAATKLPPNSVGSRHLRAGAVTPAKLSKATLKRIQRRRVGPRGQSVPGPQGAPGPKGDTGATGARGPKGDTGTVDTRDFYDKAASDARFLAAGGKAADADALDGVDSGDLARAGVWDERPGGWSWSGARDCLPLAGSVGPEVTVDVGPSGLVEVYAQAQIVDFGRVEARVQLYEESSLPSCPTILRGNPAVNGGDELKRTTAAGDGGTTGAGGTLIFRVAPGRRTFTLRYGSNPDAGFTAIVRDRLLWVRPL